LPAPYLQRAKAFEFNKERVAISSISDKLFVRFYFSSHINIVGFFAIAAIIFPHIEKGN